MREFYTTAEATEKPFLFISYSHNDQNIVKAWTDYLIDQGVRVWWDKAFMGGDDWVSIAEQLLSHENCRGILFFCSQSAIESPNVAKEWRAAAHAKEARPEGGFYPQIVMVPDDPSFDYKYLTGFVKKTEKLFSDEDYDDFRSLFGKKEHIYFVAGKEEDKESLLQTIKARVPQTVDERAIIRDKLADIANPDKDVIVKLGSFGSEKKPLLWRQINDPEQPEATLLCQEVLTESLGGEQVAQWLQQFVRDAFTAEEQAELQGKVRLLTTEEAAEVPQEELAAGRLWWLADYNGNLQAVVREDGTVYRNGYNNKLYAKGIRPVITMDITKLYSIATKHG